MHRSNEEGFAIVMAMFMTLLVSAIGATMTYTARTETLSTMSYATMAQARYSAESGLATGANYLLSAAYGDVAPGSAGDALANYDISVSPVRYNNTPVILSSDPDAPSNYPVNGVIAAFQNATSGSLDVGNGTVLYRARATLLAMREIQDHFSGQPQLLQTWEITGIGTRDGMGSAEVEVSAIIERQAVPVFSYAAFATNNGCNALSFAGGATTRSYNSAAPAEAPWLSHGHVGTNGNLTGSGDPTTIYGTLSTPRSGIGACTAANVTAATIAGWANVEEGLVTLPQPVEMPDPEPINPPPPLTATSCNQNNGCTNPPLYYQQITGGARISPPSATTVVQMGNVTVQGSGVLELEAGIYEVNSLTLTGNGTIKVNSGPVIIRIAGENESMPLDLSGGGVSNPSMDPTQLQFIYGGDKEIKITGGTDTAALVYAPNATALLSGASTHFYGSIITNKVTATGGFNLYYDRRLQTMMMTAGNPVMSTFSWRTF